MIKKFQFFILGMIVSIACSTVSSPLRKFSKRTYRPCSDDIRDNVGKFCFRYCKKYKAFGKNNSLKCKEWGLDVKDFSDPKDFYAFREGGFILLNENRVR